MAILLVAASRGRRPSGAARRRIGNVAGLDGHPLRCLHPGQAGCFLDRTAAGLAGFLDAGAKQPAPDLPADQREVILIV